MAKEHINISSKGNLQSEHQQGKHIGTLGTGVVVYAPHEVWELTIFTCE